ncbi:hypothetical protein ACU639_36845 [Streptomyces cynarae]
MEDGYALLVGGQAEGFHCFGAEGGAVDIGFLIEDVDADAFG